MKDPRNPTQEEFVRELGSYADGLSEFALLALRERMNAEVAQCRDELGEMGEGANVCSWAHYHVARVMDDVSKAFDRLEMRGSN